MKKIIVPILIFLSVATVSFAGGRQPGRRLEMVKIAYGNKQLSLTPEEAEKFWPLYRNYLADLKKARLDNRNDVLAQDENVLITRKKYREEFKKILGANDRINKAFMLERDFNTMIRRELQQRMQTRKRNS